MMSEIMEGMVEPKKASELLGKSVDWLCRHRTTKSGGPPFHRIGGRIYYQIEELREWVRSRRVVPQ